jgi:hypothetical protein
MLLPYAVVLVSSAIRDIIKHRKLTLITIIIMAICVSQFTYVPPSHSDPYLSSRALISSPTWLLL